MLIILWWYFTFWQNLSHLFSLYGKRWAFSTHKIKNDHILCSTDDKKSFWFGLSKWVLVELFLQRIQLLARGSDALKYSQFLPAQGTSARCNVTLVFIKVITLVALAHTSAADCVTCARVKFLLLFAEHITATALDYYCTVSHATAACSAENTPQHATSCL